MRCLVLSVAVMASLLSPAAAQQQDVIRDIERVGSMIGMAAACLPKGAQDPRIVAASNKTISLIYRNVAAQDVRDAIMRRMTDATLRAADNQKKYAANDCAQVLKVFADVETGLAAAR